MASEPGWEDILAIISKGQKGRAFPLHEDVMQLGRSSNNDIVLDDPLASRHHARLERQADGWTITDLNSFNGTYVDGVRIRTPCPLRYGNRVKVGDTMMIFRRQQVKAARLDERRTALAQRLADLRGELDELVLAVAEEAQKELETLRQRLAEYDEFMAAGATERAERLLADTQAGLGELDRRLPLLREQSQRAQRMAAAHKAVSQLLADVDEGLVAMGHLGTEELRRARSTLRRRLKTSQKAYEARDFRKAQVVIDRDIARKGIDRLQQALVDLQSDYREQEGAEEAVEKHLKRLTGQLNTTRQKLTALAKRDADSTLRAGAGEIDPPEARLRKVREELAQRLARLRDPIDALDIALKAARALPDFTLPEERRARAAVRSFQRAERLLARDRVREAKASLDEVDEEQVEEWHETLRAKLEEME